MPFDDHDDDAEIISEGPASTVTRVEPNLPNGPRIIAVKTSSTAYAKEPHDIVKEVRLIASISHANIIPLIKQQYKSQYLSLWMPYIPYSLDELFESSRFSPHPIISFGSVSSNTTTLREIEFVVLSKSVIFQVLCGVSYLHGEHVRIAHRDIKPANVLLTASGRVQLIDFGISFRAGEDDTARARDLWPESAARMYFEVSTGPYRAPELLFGPRSYDPFAIDAWSLGATFAQFFTALCLHSDDPDASDDDGLLESASSEPTPLPPETPFVIPRRARPRPGIPTGRWTRTTLFDGTHGEIGLAWSIFRVRGTPDQHTWPSFATLPDANKVSFIHVDAMDLSTLLPNLPPSSPLSDVALDTRTHTLPPDRIPSPLDLIHRFLVYEPAHRLRPAEALGHPWFGPRSGVPGVVLPADDEDHTVHPVWRGEEMKGVTRSFSLEGTTHTLGELLRRYVAAKEN